jgi:uncharacterized protein YbcI
MQLHRRYYGRGPTKGKAHLIDDMVICVLWNGFTTVEETLIGRGERLAVEGFRRTFQSAMEQQFTEVVENATERKVLAYLSQVHAEPDVAVELFLLEPSHDGDGSGTPATVATATEPVD